MSTPYQDHIAKWRDCRACPLWTQRTRVVFAGGVLPCDILLVGEAPGQGEDRLGVPFVGPAGSILDEIVAEAIPKQAGLRIGKANMVSCFPKEAKKTEDHRPPLESIKACAKKLRELIPIASPMLIVCVGSTAKDYIHLSADTASDKLDVIHIIHPAALLPGRMKVAQAGQARSQAVVQLRSAAAAVWERKNKKE